MLVQLVKCAFAIWVLSVVASPVSAIKLVTTNDNVEDDNELDMSELKCAVPSLRSKFQKACSIEEERVANTPLKPLEISPARFAKTSERITKNAYRMGLPPEIRGTLLDYCNKVGITERFRDLVVRGKPLDPDSNSKEKYAGVDWVLQRPSYSLWHNNMHWFSPADSQAFEEYLKVLGDANFDAVLDKIGSYFGFDSMVVYALSFHAVSYAPKGGFVHVDMEDTGSKAWNVLVPLILANETGPELGVLQVDPETDKKRLALNRYEKDVAMLIGDDAFHVTARCDYRGTDYMRMVAIIYVADVRMDNVDTVMKSNFGQPFPPEGDTQWLYDHAGQHWGKQGQSLPTHSDTDAEVEAKQKIRLASNEPQNEGKIAESVEFDTVYADRFAHGILKTITDPDCMSRDFNVMNPAFDVEEAIGVFQKCKVLVLRNVFDKNFLNEYRANFTNYIQGLHDGSINTIGVTTNGEDRFLHQLDHKRWEVVLPETFAHEDLMMDQDVMNILLDDQVLGPDVVLHSLGTALAEPGAKAQRWHADNSYIFTDLFRTAGIGGHDLPSYAVTMMVPLLNMTSAHGPTEFCMGSSYLSGLGGDPKALKFKDKSLRSIIKKYMQGEDKKVCPHRRIPQLNFGDMLLFDYQIVHRGGENVSPDLRSIMYMTYSREWYKDTNFRRRETGEESNMDGEDEYEGEEYEDEGGCGEDEDEGGCGEDAEDDEEYEDEDNWSGLYEQLTRTARFAIPDGALPVDDGDREALSGGTLESIKEFLPSVV